MSTFDGKVAEFPDIRIDRFQSSPSDSNSHPSLAYFLSHVHSDHLVGLEACRSPFIYCSPATRDILLKLEKYHDRMNYATGITEQRKQTYQHLKNLLIAIPLETPTVIELSPGNTVRVTLFDANHCVGAAMFLIESGSSGKAVLYTGDIRSEMWWVDSLVRNPVLLPYVISDGMYGAKRLDKIYLDTTFVVAGKEGPFRHFRSKANGLKELLDKLSQYPKDTYYYFDAWTFGYEEVWQALWGYLGHRVHVDDYRANVYAALVTGPEPKAPEATKLVGFFCGNHYNEGCLTTGPSQIHGCEKGTGCDIWDKDFVRITPIVTYYNGIKMAELGTGGGHGDLSMKSYGPEDMGMQTDPSRRADGLPKQITFPYSRHSSYGELCNLIEAFKPRDIHPCTVDKRYKYSMKDIFGHLYLQEGVELPSPAAMVVDERVSAVESASQWSMTLPMRPPPSAGRLARRREGAWEMDGHQEVEEEL